MRIRKTLPGLLLCLALILSGPTRPFYAYSSFEADFDASTGFGVVTGLGNVTPRLGFFTAPSLAAALTAGFADLTVDFLVAVVFTLISTAFAVFLTALAGLSTRGVFPAVVFFNAVSFNFTEVFFAVFLVVFFICQHLINRLKIETFRNTYRIGPTNGRSRYLPRVLRDHVLACDSI